MKNKIDEILLTFRKNGGRITAQRRALVSLILENPDCSCKELYYIAKAKDSCVGRATVYRTVHSLEEFGVRQSAR